jgi:hypothetical protein
VERTPGIRTGPIAEAPVGGHVLLDCGCTGKRWIQRDGQIWVGVVRACAVHHDAMQLGLLVDIAHDVQWRVRPAPCER